MNYSKSEMTPHPNSLNNTAREFSPIKIPRLSIILYLIGVTLLDVNLPRYAGIKTGNILMLILLGISITLVAYKMHWRIPRPYIKSANKILAAYILLILVSSFWSPSPAGTLYQTLLISAIFFSSLIICRADQLLLIRYISFTAGVIALLSILMIFISHELAFQPFASGDRPELRGIFEHQLRLGLYMGLTLFLIALSWLNKDFNKTFPNKIIILTLIPPIIIAFIMAYARLYTLFIILAFIATYSLSKSKIIRWTTFLSILIIVLSAVYYQKTIDSALSNAGVDTSLTGRTTIWIKTLNEASRFPWLGHGFSSFDMPPYDHMWTGFYRPPHPHNSYIQAYFENGIIGLILIVCLSISHLYISVKKCKLDKKYSYSLFLAIVLILGSLTGANYASKPASLFCISLLFISAQILRSRREAY